MSLILRIHQSGQPWKDLVSAVEKFLMVRIEAGAEDVISLVLFDSSARVMRQALPILECSSQLRTILDSFRGGGTRFGPAIAKAQTVLQDTPEEYLPLLMFMSDGGSSDGESEMQNSNAALHGDGLLVKTIAFGSGADVSKLRMLAEMGKGEFLEAADGLQLQECFQQTAASLGHSF